MAKWFGEGCKYHACQFEYNDYEQSSPVLVFCSHPDNPDEHEGNCCERLCPIAEKEE